MCRWQTFLFFPIIIFPCTHLFFFSFFCSLVVNEVYLTLQKLYAFGIWINPVLQVKKQVQRGPKSVSPLHLCVRATLRANGRKVGQSGHSREARTIGRQGIAGSGGSWRCHRSRVRPSASQPSCVLSAGFTLKWESPTCQQSWLPGFQAYTLNPTYGNFRENTETVFPPASVSTREVPWLASLTLMPYWTV